MTNRKADNEMSVLEHIEELRSRLLKALIALAAGTFISMLITDKSITILASPIGGLDSLQSIEVTENISVFMRVSLIQGAILAMPIILYQILMFVLPGLLPGEKKWVYWGVPAASIFFFAGVAFAYFVLLSPAVNFLIQFLGVNTTPRLANYIGFVTNLLFWMGISFETPLIVFILAKLKLVSSRSLIKGWRFALVGIAILSAAITPTVDPVNMALMMGPLIFIYFLSIILASLA